MPIINEIKQAPGLSRTVDTDTGIYMVEDGVSMVDQVYCFKAFDGSNSISFSAAKVQKVDEEKQANKICYYLNTVRFGGAPLRSGYQDIMIQLLKCYGDHFRYSERRFGYTETVSVEINENIGKKITNWESGNV